MKLRKIIAFALILLITTSLFATQALAWGGYAHWEMADRASTSLSSYDATFYKSGALFADLGKSTWDSNYTVSDSKAFANKIVEIANDEPWSGTGTKFLAYGWMAHYIQDTQGSLANIETTKSWWPSEYRGKCGWVDEYLRDDQNITCPINGTEGVGINYDLIRMTYEELDNFSPTDTQIDNEIADMYALYHVQIALNIFGWCLL